MVMLEVPSGRDNGTGYVPGWTPWSTDLPWGGPGEPRRPWNALFGEGGINIDWGRAGTAGGTANPSPAPTPGYQGGQSPFTRVPASAAAASTTDSGMPRSPDAASVWAQGGVNVIRAEQEKRLLDPSNPNSLFSMMAGKQYVGIEDNAEWIRQGNVPFLGYDAKGGVYGNPYQLPEYTVDEVGATLQRMSAEELADFRSRAIAAGIWDPDVYPSSYGVTQEDIRIMSSLMAQANWGKATSWQSLLYELEQNPNPEVAEGLEGDGGSGSGFEPSTTTNIVYSKTSLDAGRSYMRALAAELLGREPSDAEVRRYIGALNRVENRRPSITETTRTMGDNENDIINTSRVKQNAPDVGEFLRQRIESGNAGEKATYQAQNYFARLLEVI